MSTPTWTTAQMPDQTGRTFIITGANSGLGLMAAKAVAAKGARVVLACRNAEKARAAADEVGGGAQASQLDLADLASVRRFAADAPKCDVLINNAGVMAVPLQRTADGFEMQIGTNHLGHFALTGLLLSEGKVTERVVTMSSFAHRWGRISLSDLNWERRRYNRWAAYGQSKLANLLFAYELARTLAAADSSIASLAAHPGYSATNLTSHTQSVQGKILAVGDRLVAQSAAMGALPGLYAATSPDAESGAFYGPGGLFGVRGFPAKAGSTKSSHDPHLARRLWELSEKLTGVEF